MTNHVARAKAWISRAAVASALTVMPLAMAQAVVSLPTNGGCDSSGMSGVRPRLTPACTVTQLGTLNGINGVNILLTTPFTRNLNSVDFNYFGNGLVGGSGSAAIGTPFSISYSITVSGASGGSGSFNAVLRSATFATQFDTGFITLTPGTNTGTRTGTVGLSGITAGQTENLFTSVSYFSSTTPVSISAFNISFNPAPANVTATPEPASAVVLAAGLVGLARMRRRA